MHKRNPVFRIPFVSDVSVCFRKLLGKFLHRIWLSVNGYLLGHQVEVVLPEHDLSCGIDADRRPLESIGLLSYFV